MMNSLTHFLFALNLLLIFVPQASLLQVLTFAVMFGVMVDIDVFWRMGIKKDKSPITRTWLQEPFGVLVVGGSLAVLLQTIWGAPYALLVLIPYSSHVFLDYIATHAVRPFDPFSKRIVHVSLIKTSGFCVGHGGNLAARICNGLRRLFCTQEAYVTIGNAILLILIAVR